MEGIIRHADDVGSRSCPPLPQADPDLARAGHGDARELSSVPTVTDRNPRARSQTVLANRVTRSWARCVVCGSPSGRRSDRSHPEPVRPVRLLPSSLAAPSEQDATIAGRVESMQESDVMDVQFIASVAVITPDPNVSRRLYVDALGLPLTASEDDDYLFSEDIDGSKHFGIWPLTQAAQACFGTPDWPADRPVPQASIEFEVADADTVQVAADELKEKGYTLMHEARTEPWG
jgi:catechol 2,3-dioxygenase-like lactoylglutathione lyase family enzyme